MVYYETRYVAELDISRKRAQEMKKVEVANWAIMSALALSDVFYEIPENYQLDSTPSSIAWIKGFQ